MGELKGGFESVTWAVSSCIKLEVHSGMEGYVGALWGIAIAAAPPSWGLGFPVSKVTMKAMLSE